MLYPYYAIHLSFYPAYILSVTQSNPAPGIFAFLKPVSKIHNTTLKTSYFTCF